MPVMESDRPLVFPPSFFCWFAGSLALVSPLVLGTALREGELGAVLTLFVLIPLTLLKSGLRNGAFDWSLVVEPLEEMDEMELQETDDMVVHEEEVDELEASDSRRGAGLVTVAKGDLGIVVLLLELVT